MSHVDSQELEVLTEYGDIFAMKTDDYGQAHRFVKPQGGSRTACRDVGLQP
jgi:hypothetical protein